MVWWLASQFYSSVGLCQQKYVCKRRPPDRRITPVRRSFDRTRNQPPPTNCTISSSAPGETTVEAQSAFLTIALFISTATRSDATCSSRNNSLIDGFPAIFLRSPLTRISIDSCDKIAPLRLLHPMNGIIENIP